MIKIFKLRDIIFFTLALLLVLTFSIYLFYHYAFFFNLKENIYPSDLPHHIYFAKQIFTGKYFLIPHPGFHFIIIVTSLIFSCSFNLSSVIVLTLAILITFLLIFYISHAYLNVSHFNAIAIALMLISSIIFPHFSKNYYIGQGIPNIWHNPTYILLKPFAFFVLFFTPLTLSSDKKYNNKNFKILIAFLLLITVVIKPNFVLSFLPAFFIFLMITTSRKQLQSKITTAILLFIPSIIVLCLQYWFNYIINGSSTEGSIIIKMFYVWKYYSPNLFFSWLLANLFPLLVVSFRFSSLKKNSHFLLIILFYLISFFQMAFMVESGIKEYYWNFSWSYNLGLFFIFYITLIEYFNWIKINKFSNFKFLFPFIVVSSSLLLHICSGLFYFNRLILGFSFY